MCVPTGSSAAFLAGLRLYVYWIVGPETHVIARPILSKELYFLMYTTNGLFIQYPVI